MLKISVQNSLHQMLVQFIAKPVESCLINCQKKLLLQNYAGWISLALKFIIIMSKQSSYQTFINLPIKVVSDWFNANNSIYHYRKRSHQNHHYNPCHRCRKDLAQRSCHLHTPIVRLGTLLWFSTYSFWQRPSNHTFVSQCQRLSQKGNE